MRRDRNPAGRSDRAVYMISVAAELAGVHPQTLRFYERRGLLSPKRTSGNTRRYSERDILLLRTIQDLTQRRGVNLAGVKMIMDLQNEVERLRRRERELEEKLDRARRAIPLGPGLQAERPADIVPLRAVMTFPWFPGR